jgi:hypothetical protein
MGEIPYEIVHIILKSAFEFREKWCSISHVSLKGVNKICAYLPHIYPDSDKIRLGKYLPKFIR